MLIKMQNFANSNLKPWKSIRYFETPYRIAIQIRRLKIAKTQFCFSTLNNTSCNTDCLILYIFRQFSLWPKGEADDNDTYANELLFSLSLEPWIQYLFSKVTYCLFVNVKHFWLIIISTFFSIQEAEKCKYSMNTHTCHLNFIHHFRGSLKRLSSQFVQMGNELCTFHRFF